MRGRMAGEADGNSLFISSATSGMPSCLISTMTSSPGEDWYLVIDDGATSNEVFELVTDDASPT